MSSPDGHDGRLGFAIANRCLVELTDQALLRFPWVGTKILTPARIRLPERPQGLAALGLNPDEYRATAPAATRSVRALCPRSTLPPRVARSFYLRADQIRALDDACLDLPAALRERLSTSQVKERFMDDGCAQWLASKLEPKS